jgi:hypothetical protein
MRINLAELVLTDSQLNQWSLQELSQVEFASKVSMKLRVGHHQIGVCLITVWGRTLN